jgi:hypothetical protein
MSNCRDYWLFIHLAKGLLTTFALVGLCLSFLAFILWDAMFWGLVFITLLLFGIRKFLFR